MASIAWPDPRPYIEPLIGTAFGEYDCWQLVQHLYLQAWGVSLVTTEGEITSQLVEVWWQDDPRPPLTLVQPWDTLLFAMHGLVGDHVGVMVDDTMLVHTGPKTGVILEPVRRWQKRLLQIVRLRCVEDGTWQPCS